MSAVPTVNISIDSGTSFTATYTISNSDGSVLDLSGYTASSKIRKYPTSPTSNNFSVGINSTSGKITISMASTLTTGLSEGRNYYDIVIISPSSTTSKVIQGMAIVNSTVSE
jgi:hypothetical protein